MTSKHLDDDCGSIMWKSDLILGVKRPKVFRDKCHWLVHRFGQHSVSEQTRPHALPSHGILIMTVVILTQRLTPNKWLKANFRDDIDVSAGEILPLI